MTSSEDDSYDYKIDFERVEELIEKYKSDKIAGKIKDYS